MLPPYLTALVKRSFPHASHRGAPVPPAPRASSPRHSATPSGGASLVRASGAESLVRASERSGAAAPGGPPQLSQACAAQHWPAPRVLELDPKNITGAAPESITGAAREAFRPPPLPPHKKKTDSRKNGNGRRGDNSCGREKAQSDGHDRRAFAIEAWMRRERERSRVYWTAMEAAAKRAGPRAMMLVLQVLTGCRPRPSENVERRSRQARGVGVSWLRTIIAGPGMAVCRATSPVLASNQDHRRCLS